MNRNLFKTFPAIAATASLTLIASLGFSNATLAQNGPIRPGFNSGNLPRNDDGSTEFIDLSFDLNFFGADYEGLYVNNNGNVTFEGPLSTFTPFGLANVETPIIAPFFADVDTRNEDSAIVTYGSGQVDGRPAFGVNWDSEGVGYFSNRADKLNQFQLVVVDRSDTGAGNFDFEFNYNQIEWETGDASQGQNGLGGVSAAVGYSNGLVGDDNVSLEFIGSRAPGTFLDNGIAPLIESSLNSGVDGRYRFAVRDGDQIPPGTTPEEPVLPDVDPENPQLFNFANIPIGQNGFGVQPDLPLFFDPEIAVGYNYEITDGPGFASILIPEALPNGDSEFLLELPGFSDPFTLIAGTSFNLLEQNPNGFRRFSITGIDPEELLDPTDTLAFVTGLTFTEAGVVSFTQSAIVEDTNGGGGGEPIPEPTTMLASILIGFAGLKLKAKRK
ncbi:nidogen-like domain-containing protein [Gloeocapsa sp. PCC 73106]|uniref:nidogen-like domain-containing protein n=1 Tax=Gloeocapsa sp. PCC 73106 TaxID=102232 RepID=UPI0002ABCE00|nr:nidogen-like domain-containing protein [Gloeocapsa sp. PCC 73106]ELR99207.1 Nidogen [Gloeocapsa sp. PCC 73106]